MRAETEAAHLSLIDVLSRYPQHASGLLGKVRASEIDGMYPGGTKTNPCGCIIGSLAVILGVDRWQLLGEVRQAVTGAEWPMLPIEIFIYNLRPGHTPENNATSRQLAEWIREFIDSNPEACR